MIKTLKELWTKKQSQEKENKIQSYVQICSETLTYNHTLISLARSIVRKKSVFKKLKNNNKIQLKQYICIALNNKIIILVSMSIHFKIYFHGWAECLLFFFF